MRSVLSAPIVLGSGGRLGSQVEALLASTRPATVGATRAEIDVTDYFRVREEFERLEPTLVVNCTARADVDLCELHPEAAMQVNAEGAAHVARACREVGARLVHVSSDMVFDGARPEPYTEEDEPAPISHYGRSKLEGERRALAELPGSLVVRTSWLFGPSGGDFVERALARARGERVVGGVVDQVGCPTYTPDLAEAIVALVEAGAGGVVHFVNAGACTRHEFALKIVELARLADGLRVESQRWADLHRPAPRAANSTLATGRYTSITSRTPRSWQEALAAHLSSPGGPHRTAAERAPGGSGRPERAQP